MEQMFSLSEVILLVEMIVSFHDFIVLHNDGSTNEPFLGAIAKVFIVP